MRRKYGLRVPGTDTLIKKFWTIAGAMRVQAKMYHDYGINSELVIVNYIDTCS